MFFSFQFVKLSYLTFHKSQITKNELIQNKIIHQHHTLPLHTSTTCENTLFIIHPTLYHHHPQVLHQKNTLEFGDPSHFELKHYEFKTNEKILNLLINTNKNKTHNSENYEHIFDECENQNDKITLYFELLK